jgi:hypothetical protein
VADTLWDADESIWRYTLLYTDGESDAGYAEHRVRPRDTEDPPHRF